MKTNNSLTDRIEENLSSILRAMVLQDNLEIKFDEKLENNFFTWNQTLIGINKSILLPSLKNFSEEEKSEQLIKLRASANLSAAYLLFHDFEIVLDKDFSEEEKVIFNEFEKIRVLAEIRNIYFGAAKSILEKIEDDVFQSSNNISLVLLKEIFADFYLEKTNLTAINLEKKLNQKIVKEIKNLAKKTTNQKNFASGVIKILQLLQQEKEAKEKNKNEKTSKENSINKQDSKDDLVNFGQENINTKVPQDFLQNQEEEGEQKLNQEQKISQLKESEELGKVKVKLDEKGILEEKIQFKNPYKVFTTKFDEIVFPQKLVSKNELELLRNQLDLKVGKLAGISKKMTLKLKRKLLSKRNSFIEFDTSCGILNRKKLTRLVIDPFTEDVWINNKEYQYQNTCLTILLDNSGSMRGQPIVMSAMACEIIADILEKFSIKTEIIGFTTADWKGGKARKLWESQGREKNPGRLNELRHIVYKHFNQKFKKSKINLGLMLKEGILKENIDGEALLFANSRLMQQSEKRKILLIISDGTPVDDSTNSANDSDILTDHLHHVINKIENNRRNCAKVEVIGIGIGHSTEEFYRNSIAIKTLSELGDVMIEKIVHSL